MRLKPTHKAIKTYHATLDQFEGQHVTHELATRSAFQTLLADTARARKWMLIPELATRTRGRRIVPDGTLRDEFSIPRGFWEAKNTQDDHDAEIQDKIAKGYPTSNIIYDEDGTNRRENITDCALKTFRDQYKDTQIDKWAIFHYV